MRSRDLAGGGTPPVEPTLQEHKMLPSSYTGAFSKTAALSAFLLAAGCGGGASTEPASTDSLATHEHEHEHEQQADAAAAAAAASAQTDALAATTSVLTVKETIQLATTYTALGPATINVPAAWPVWYGVGGGKTVDGVGCFATGQVHVHGLISIYKDGKRLGFPDGIGRVHAGCRHAYEMHVHDATGIIHMESDAPKTFKLGQWFSLWGQPLGTDLTAGLAGPVRFYIIEKGTITPYAGNPYDIEMKPRREVLIVSGTTMSVVPRYQWPSGL